MHIGILTARDADYHSNRRLAEAASSLDQKVSLIHPKDCLSEVWSGRLNLRIKQREALPDVLLPRIGATINEYALTLVRQFGLNDIPVVNDFESILLAKNKFLSLQTLAGRSIPLPDSYHVSNALNYEKAVLRLGGYPVVVKTLSGRQGSGVTLVESPKASRFVIQNILNNIQGIIVQEYIPPENRKDIRVFIIGGRVVAALALEPKRGEFRANIHRNGKGKKVSVPHEITKLALSSTKALGLEISGVDIIVDQAGRPKVIEVNYSPGFKGLEAHTGKDIAAEVIRYIMRTYGEERA